MSLLLISHKYSLINRAHPRHPRHPRHPPTIPDHLRPSPPVAPSPSHPQPSQRAHAGLLFFAGVMTLAGLPHVSLRALMAMFIAVRAHVDSLTRTEVGRASGRPATRLQGWDPTVVDFFVGTTHSFHADADAVS